MSLNALNLSRAYWQWQCGSVSVSFQSLPSLPQLRSHLGIEDINTGRQIRVAGIVSDDLEGLHAECDEQDRICLCSGVEFSMRVYRGQTQEHNPCFPTLGRLKEPEDQLLALCRIVAFEDAIADHPFVRLTELSTFLGKPLFVDKEWLAQHYGLRTNMLDVTSNFDVASFFATCAWNSDTRSYEPVTDITKHGVIYMLTPALMFDPVTPHSTFGSFHTVGWQPLSRPEQQRAFAVKLKPGQSFHEIPSVTRFPFRHRARISQRIWKAFDEGRMLFPPDAAAELAAQAQTLHQFTRHQIDRAWQRFENWTSRAVSFESRSIIENRGGITEIALPSLDWSGLDVETDESRLIERLQDVFNRVRYRMASYL